MSPRARLLAVLGLALLAWGLVALLVWEPRILFAAAGCLALWSLTRDYRAAMCRLGLHAAGRRVWYTTGGVRREVELCPRCGHREVISEEKAPC